MAVIATATTGQSGWNNSWVASMKALDDGIVLEVADDAQGINVRTESGSWCYPFWVLIKLEDE